MSIPHETMKSDINLLDQPITIFWFRRDLRLIDNSGLYHALNENVTIAPIFIFDTDILSRLEPEDSRVSFIYRSIEKLDRLLKPLGGGITTYLGKPIEIFSRLIAKYRIQALYFNMDYEPAARSRDRAVYELMERNHITVKAYKDQVIFHKNEILKPDLTPYQVFTPYSQKWKQTLTPNHYSSYRSEQLLHKTVSLEPNILSMSDIGFVPSKISEPAYSTDHDLWINYPNTRNIPSIAGTTRLSVALRFGTVSIRHLVKQAIELQAESLLNELIWREFFMQILWHYPETVHQSFKPIYDRIQWLNNPSDIEAWCLGTTGYPMVDAAMIELNRTGLMHNRCRMIVASFLCKHLLVDWRIGEAYFAKHLLDYEQSSNVGNWQWAAGCGVDAAPYFRIFNPYEQQKKFDPQLQYIKQWIPHYTPQSYIPPIVDHTIARNRCLDVYKQALNSN